MTVVSRLTYCMYLVHPSVIFWLYAQQHSPVHFSGLWLCVTYLGAPMTFHLFNIPLIVPTYPHTKQQTSHRTGVLALTILCAAAVHLTVEQPAANLQRLLLGGGGGGGRRCVKSNKDEAFPPLASWRGNGKRGRSMTMSEEGEEEEGKEADGRMVEMVMVVGAQGEAKHEV